MFNRPNFGVPPHECAKTCRITTLLSRSAIGAKKEGPLGNVPSPHGTAHYNTDTLHEMAFGETVE